MPLCVVYQALSSARRMPIAVPMAQKGLGDDDDLLCSPASYTVTATHTHSHRYICISRIQIHIEHRDEAGSRGFCLGYRLLHTIRVACGKWQVATGKWRRYSVDPDYAIASCLTCASVRYRYSYTANKRSTRTKRAISN